jgi:hypothetical protein
LMCKHILKHHTSIVHIDSKRDEKDTKFRENIDVLVPMVASPDDATKARREVRTGLEQGEATNADVAPNRNA